MLFLGALLLLLGGAMVARPNAADTGDLTGLGVGIFLLGLLFVGSGVGVLRWRKRPRTLEGPASPSRPSVEATDRPEAAVARMQEAQASVQAAEFKRALEPLWDEVYEASRRRDSKQLEAIQVLAEQIRRASTADKRVQKSASRLADTAASHLSTRREQAALSSGA